MRGGKRVTVYRFIVLVDVYDPIWTVSYAHGLVTQLQHKHLGISYACKLNDLHFTTLATRALIESPVEV